MASQPLYQLYLELEDYEPKIWRRIQVMNNIKFARLGYIIMTLFEMQASHLYEFEIDLLENFKRRDREFWEEDSDAESRIKKRRVGILDEDNIYDFNNLEGYEPLKDSTEEYVKHYIYDENDEMIFKYDFGDNWRVKVKIEKIFEDKEIDGREFPRVIEGQGYGIIENCGGTGGLEEIRKAFTLKKGDEYENYSNWLGVEELDLDTFDIDDMNFRLKKVPRIYADCYEYELEPTKQSIKILQREYLKKKN